MSGSGVGRIRFRIVEDVNYCYILIIAETLSKGSIDIADFKKIKIRIQEKYSYTFSTNQEAQNVVPHLNKILASYSKVYYPKDSISLKISNNSKEIYNTSHVLVCPATPNTRQAPGECGNQTGLEALNQAYRRIFDEVENMTFPELDNQVGSEGRHLLETVRVNIRYFMGEVNIPNAVLVQGIPSTIQVNRFIEYYRDYIDLFKILYQRVIAQYQERYNNQVFEIAQNTLREHIEDFRNGGLNEERTLELAIGLNMAVEERFENLIDLEGQIDALLARYFGVSLENLYYYHRVIVYNAETYLQDRGVTDANYINTVQEYQTSLENNVYTPARNLRRVGQRRARILEIMARQLLLNAWRTPETIRIDSNTLYDLLRAEAEKMINEEW